MSQVLKYSIIRYYPWSERDEFINVVVVIESSSGVVYRILDPRHYNYKTILSPTEVQELWEVFEFSMFRTREFAFDKVRRQNRVPRRLSMPVERCLAELSGELQCSDIRTIFVQRDDPHLIVEYLNSLFDRQVVRHARKPRRRYPDRHRLLKRRLRSDLAQWEVLEKLLQGQELTVTVSWPMDFLYRSNGSESGIRVLDCSLTRSVSEAIRIVYGATRDIEETKRLDVSVIAVAGNRDVSPDTFNLANRVLRDRGPVLRLIDYDTDQGREELRRILGGKRILRERLV